MIGVLAASRRRVATIRASRRRMERLRQAAIVVILSLGALAMILPFEWMIATSLSREANIGMPRYPRFWPPDASLFNYMVATTNLPLLRYYLNSVVVVGATTAGYLLFSSLAGYAFAKGRFPGRTVLFLAFLVTLLVPFEMRMIPLYTLMRDLHLNNTMAALIVPFLVGGFGTFLMRQYISTVPDDLIDAARLDGASEFAIYRLVVLPLCKPVLAALAVINVIWRWNDLVWPLMAVSDRDLYTVTLGLALAARGSQDIAVGVALATATLAVLPVIVIYVVLQRYIIRGITLTGMRG
jgi:ABC-type glycerol-3-phosphate transport system permease component